MGTHQQTERQASALVRRRKNVRDLMERVVMESGQWRTNAIAKLDCAEREVRILERKLGVPS